jgi:hypothetical protein
MKRSSTNRRRRAPRIERPGWAKHQILAVAAVGGAVTTAPTSWVNTVQFQMAESLRSPLLQSSGGLQLAATALGTVLIRVVAGSGRRAMVIALLVCGAAALFVAASTGAVAALTGELVEGVSGPSAGDLAPILLRAAIADSRTRGRLTVTLSTGQYTVVTVLVVGMSPLGLILGYRWPFALTGALCIGLAAWSWRAFRHQPSEPQIAELLKVNHRHNFELAAQEPAIEDLDERLGWRSALFELAREVRRAGWPFRLTMAASVIGKMSFTAFYAVYVIVLVNLGLSGVALGLTVAGLQLAQFVTVGPLARWDHVLQRHPTAGRLVPYVAGLAWLVLPLIGAIPAQVGGDAGKPLAVAALVAVFALIDIYSNLTKAVVSVDAMDDPRLSERRRVDRGLLDLLFGLSGSALGAGLAPLLRTHGLVAIATALVFLAAALQIVRLQLVKHQAHRRPTHLPWRVSEPIRRDSRRPRPVLVPDAELGASARWDLMLAALSDAYYLGSRNPGGARLITPVIQLRDERREGQLVVTSAELAALESEAGQIFRGLELQPLLLTSSGTSSLVLTSARLAETIELAGLGRLLDAFPMLGQTELAHSHEVIPGQTTVPWFDVERIGRRQPTVLLDADLAQARYGLPDAMAAAMAAGMSRGGGRLLIGLGSAEVESDVQPTGRIIAAYRSYPHRLSAQWRHVAARAPGVRGVGHVLPAVERDRVSIIVPVVLEQHPGDAAQAVEACLAALVQELPGGRVRVVSEGRSVHQT